MLNEMNNFAICERCLIVNFMVWKGQNSLFMIGAASGHC